MIHYSLRIACLLFPLCLLALPRGEQRAIQNTLYGLQQLRTVIPERLWSDEFAVIVDQAAFAKVASEEKTPPAKTDALYPTYVGISSSDYYFLYAVTSGEPIRLDDRYLRFINSPYWNSPEAIRKLFYLQHNHKKVVR